MDNQSRLHPVLANTFQRIEKYVAKKFPKQKYKQHILLKIFDSRWLLHPSIAQWLDILMISSSHTLCCLNCYFNRFWCNYHFTLRAQKQTHKREKIWKIHWYIWFLTLPGVKDDQAAGNSSPAHPDYGSRGVDPPVWAINGHNGLISTHWLNKWCLYAKPGAFKFPSSFAEIVRVWWLG